MIEGLIGMAVAFVVFVLVLVFYKKTPNPSVALPLNAFLTSQGFDIIDTAHPKVKDVKEVLKLTNHKAFVEQAYLRSQDDILICWISSSEGENNDLISAIPQNSRSDAWILIYLLGLQDGLGGFVQRLYQKMVLPSGFSKVQALGSENAGICLFVKNPQAIPQIDYKFIEALKRCGSMIIRCDGKGILLQRLAIAQNQSWQDEAKGLIDATEVLRGLV